MRISSIISVTRKMAAKRTYYAELERRLAEGIESNKFTYLYVYVAKDKAEIFS